MQNKSFMSIKELISEESTLGYKLSEMRKMSNSRFRYEQDQDELSEIEMVLKSKASSAVKRDVKNLDISKALRGSPFKDERNESKRSGSPSPRNVELL